MSKVKQIKSKAWYKNHFGFLYQALKRSNNSVHSWLFLIFDYYRRSYFAYSASNLAKAVSITSFNAEAEASIFSCSASVNGISMTCLTPWRLMIAGAPI